MSQQPRLFRQPGVVRRAALLTLLASTLSAGAAFAGTLVWPSAIAKVERDLNATEASTRRAAAERLFALPLSALQRLLPQALNDGDNDVKLLAAAAAKQANLQHAPEVASWLRDQDVRLRLAAIDLFELLPEARVAPDLVRALGDPEAAVRRAAVRALVALGSSDVVLPILGRIDDSDGEVRGEVMNALGELEDQRATVPLMGKLQDPRPSVRAGVLGALGRLQDARALPALKLALTDSEVEVKVAALGALGAMRAAEAVSAIAPLAFGVSNEQLTLAALRALSQIDSEAAATALFNALTAEDDELSELAQAAIHRGSSSLLQPLQRCLFGQPALPVANACVRALRKVEGEQAAALILSAVQRRVVSIAPALSALAELTYQPALPLALEYLSSPDRDTQLRAAELTAALLDPAKPNGLAVDPILRALDEVRKDPKLQETLVRALGATASPRARPYLMQLLQGTPRTALRMVGLEAAGFVGGKELLPAVLSQLDDANAAIRSTAALSLRRMAEPTSFAALWARLTQSPSQDRQAVAVALAGPLKSLSDPKQVSDLVTLIAQGRSPLRDTLIESASFVPGAASESLFSQLMRENLGDAGKAKMAEALAGHPNAAALLKTLFASTDARTRANAVWSLGESGAAADIQFMQGALRDPDPAVAANAVAALARSMPAGEALSAILCAALAEPRPYVRWNALAGLRHAALRCTDDRETTVLRRDDTASVRTAAATLLREVPSSDSSQKARDERALRRCFRKDPDFAVAQACDDSQRAPAVDKEGTTVVTVFVVPSGQTEPAANAPFALQRADGFVRCGWTDSRGAVFEPHAPKGTVRLVAPQP